MRKFIILLFLMFLGTIMQAKPKKNEIVELKIENKELKVECLNVDEAMKEALERAIDKAIEEKFGRRETREEHTYVDNDGSSYKSYGISQLKGELTEIIEHKEEIIHFDNESRTFTIRVSARFRAKERQNNNINLSVKVLSNPSDENETLHYQNGDYVYVSLQSNVSGYVAMYLRNEDNEVRNILPYIKDSQNTSYFVNENDINVFFVKDNDFFRKHNKLTRPTNPDIINRIRVACDSPESNTLYILFSSRSPIGKPFMDVKDNMRTMSSESFEEWLHNSAEQDEFLTYQKRTIQIKNTPHK